MKTKIKSSVSGKEQESATLYVKEKEYLKHRYKYDHDITAKIISFRYFIMLLSLIAITAVNIVLNFIGGEALGYERIDFRGIIALHQSGLFEHR